MDYPKVSVVIPTYNRSNETKRAAESVLNQTYPSVELIIVDDGSTDGTREVLQPLSDNIKYLRQENRGPGSARNKGVAASTGEWLAFLDSDDVWRPNKIERQLEFSMYCGVEASFHDSEHGLPQHHDFIPSWNNLVCSNHLKRAPVRSEVLEDAYQILLLAAHFFLTSSFMITKDAFEESGGYTTSLGTNQDIDLYLRLSPRYTVAYLAEVLVSYLPAPERAWQMAEKRSSDPKLKNKLIVYHDRVRAVKRSFYDRVGCNDLNRAKLARAGLLLQLRSLAGAYRRQGLIDASLLTYLEFLQTLAIPTSRLYAKIGEQISQEYCKKASSCSLLR